MIKSVLNIMKQKVATPNGERLRVSKFFYMMLLFVPISLYLGYFTHNLLLTFITSILAIIPLAQILGFATKEITLQTNPKIGGLLSATFGNAIELSIAIFALMHGLVEVVQASIIGSILCNLLLVIGLSLFTGGLKHKYQKFNKEAAGVSSTMLIIAVVGLVIPTTYALTIGKTQHSVLLLSDLVAIILALIYIAGLFFSLRTHKDLFDVSDELRLTNTVPSITKKQGAILIAISTVVVAFISEAMVDTFQTATADLGITQTFIGVIVISFITNIAEFSIATRFAKEDKLDISLQIGLSSATQVALFVVPILMVLSNIFNWGFSLVFTLFDVISIIFAVMIINHLASDGRCNWLEGAQLISVYLIVAVAFFFIA